jgi:hypothetical protein
MTELTYIAAAFACQFNSETLNPLIESTGGHVMWTSLGNYRELNLYMMHFGRSLVALLDESAAIGRGLSEVDTAF